MHQRIGEGSSCGMHKTLKIGFFVAALAGCGDMDLVDSTIDSSVGQPLVDNVDPLLDEREGFGAIVTGGWVDGDEPVVWVTSELDPVDHRRRRYPTTKA